ncbi:hypothetical protein HPB50_012334 [Hyalomma asiaticum]|uniref:Uncharacterized protein n=1 Tax=Hyalomma asiaticum TaxID=266040 RepID=A0ACB7RP05_HYAAI|nr:hypothetical protein HPB50_012334 [Hyalomma asiaticum]
MTARNLLLPGSTVYDSHGKTSLHTSLLPQKDRDAVQAPSDQDRAGDGAATISCFSYTTAGSLCGSPYSAAELLHIIFQVRAREFVAVVGLRIWHLSVFVAWHKKGNRQRARRYEVPAAHARFWLDTVAWCPAGALFHHYPDTACSRHLERR